MTKHEKLYPAQYSHPLVRHYVRVVSRKTGKQLACGIVERVVRTRFGRLAILVGHDRTAWSVNDCVMGEAS